MNVCLRHKNAGVFEDLGRENCEIPAPVPAMSYQLTAGMVRPPALPAARPKLPPAHWPVPPHQPNLIRLHPSCHPSL